VEAEVAQRGQNRSDCRAPGQFFGRGIGQSLRRCSLLLRHRAGSGRRRGKADLPFSLTQATLTALFGLALDDPGAEPLYELVAAIPDRRFGFITSKKASKKAVTRNLLRRRFREIIRKHGDTLLPHQMVVTIARWRAAEATFAELEADWLKTARKLNTYYYETKHSRVFLLPLRR
jgi:ribonuclease P protein component